MFAYIVRRLLWAVGLLIVLSIVTFSIFYWCRDWPGRPRKRWRHVTWGGPLPRRRSTDCRTARVLRPGARAVLELDQGVFSAPSTTMAQGWSMSCPLLRILLHHPAGCVA